MLHDPARVAECRAWLDRVRADLKAAAILLEADQPQPGTALFHCQQAVEKSWKAFLIWYDVPFRRTHDLRELGQACEELDRSLARLALQAEDLTQFAWVFRYPGESEAPELEEARDALELARAVNGADLSRLPLDMEE